MGIRPLSAAGEPVPGAAPGCRRCDASGVSQGSSPGTAARDASPGQAPASRAAALERANQVRAARRAIKEQLSDAERGRRLAARVVLAPPSELDTLTVYDLLLWLHQVQRTRALAHLQEASVGERRPVGNLTPRERRALAAVILNPRAAAARVAR